MKKTQRRRQLHIFVRACLTSCLALLLLAMTFTSTASAWFYFASPKSVTIVTPETVPLHLTVWRLNENGEPTEYVTTTDSGTNIPIDLDLNFFRWGSRYFCETDEAVYYAFELTYDSDVFTKDSRLPLNAEFTANLTYSATNESGGTYTVDGDCMRFPFYTVSYVVGQDAGIAFTGHAAYHEAQRTVSYTDLITADDLAAVDALGSNASGTIDRTVEDTSLSHLSAGRYKQIITTEEGSSSRLRLIIYVRIQPDMDLINDNLVGNVNLSDQYLTLHTTLTLCADFKTFPTYTGKTT